MTGELVIAATPSISMGWLIPMVGSFSQKYPVVEIRLLSIEPHTHDLPKQFDLALCLSQPDTNKYQLRVLYQEHYLAVCKPSLIKDEKPIGEAIYLVTDIEPQQSIRTRLFAEHMTKELHALGMFSRPAQ